LDRSRAALSCMTAATAIAADPDVDTTGDAAEPLAAQPPILIAA